MMTVAEVVAIFEHDKFGYLSFLEADLKTVQNPVF